MQIEITKNLRLKAEVYQKRTTWGHIAELYLKDQKIAEAKRTYYNRTWEAYQFESVFCDLLNKAKKEDLLSKHHLRLLEKTIKNGGQVEQKRIKEQFKTVANVAKLGALFTDNQKDCNDWQARMIKAGLGLEMPEDWSSLTEEEKAQRLQKVLEIVEE